MSIAIHNRKSARWLVSAAIAGSFIVSLSAIAGPASASTFSTEEGQPVVPTDEVLVIDGQPTDIAVLPDFNPDGPVTIIGDDGTVSADSVELVEDGVSEDVGTGAAARAGCSRSWVAPATGTYHTTVDGCSVIGLNSTTKVHYSYTVDSNSVGNACMKGRGYYYQSNPSGGSWYATWRNTGCGASNGADVLWGKVASVKKAQFLATTSPGAGAAGLWS